MNLDELDELARTYIEEAADVSHEVRVCMAASCQSSGARPVLDALHEARNASGANHCRVKGVGCMGLCSAGPLVTLSERDASLNGSKIYRDVTADHAEALIGAAGTDTSADAALAAQRCPSDLPFFNRQQKVVLEHAGVIDPDSFKGYVAVGGYRAMVQALTEMTPAEVVAEVTTSGLRGRGGGGYPTGLKWSTVAKMPGEQKYVICNATRVTRAPSWTAQSWSRTRTACSRAWPLLPMRSVPTRAISTFAPSTRSRSNA
jgi:bidirectional [NiFe] hydrogenase diaphorase subunit